MKNNIVLIRKQNKIKQLQVAKAAGVSRQSIYSIERGIFTPTVDTAIKIARFFGKPVEEIFFLDDVWLVSAPRMGDSRELITGQGLEKYAALKYGKFSFSFNGGEIAAVCNAMGLLGKSVGVAETIEEFENNNMPVMLGFAGTDVKRLGEYFDGHGVKYEKTANKDEFCDKLTDGKVFIAAYYDSVKHPIHTVAGVVEKETVKVYNLHDADETPSSALTSEFFGRRSFICGYVF